MANSFIFVIEEDPVTGKEVDHIDIDLTISASADDVNLFTLSNSPAVAQNVRVTINAGVEIGGTVAGSPALTTGAFVAGSTITIINNGAIQGRGGNGGKGGAEDNDYNGDGLYSGGGGGGSGSSGGSGGAAAGGNATPGQTGFGNAGGTGGTSSTGSAESFAPQAGSIGNVALNLTISTTLNNTNGILIGGGGGGAGGSRFTDLPTGIGGAGGGLAASGTANLLGDVIVASAGGAGKAIEQNGNTLAFDPPDRGSITGAVS